MYCSSIAVIVLSSTVNQNGVTSSRYS